MSAFEIIWNNRQAFLSGLYVTLQLAGLTWAVGLTMGTALGSAASLAPRLVGWPIRGLAVLLAGVPFLVLLYWANYPLQQILRVSLSPFATSAGLLCLINIVIVAEIWRGALSDFPRGYTLAGRTAGMSRTEILRFVQLPILLRQVLPGLIAAQVAILQLTLFSSLISVEELFRVAQEINSNLQRPIEIYSGLALFFFLVTVPLYGAAYLMRRRFTRDLSET